MSYSLFLDDVRYPKQVTWTELPLVEWKIVRNYDEFVRFITQNGLPTRVSFDHDLADSHYSDAHSTTIPYESYTEKTGYDCAKWLAKYCAEHKLPFPETFVHSLNPVGSDNIKSIVQSFRKIYGSIR